LEPLAQGAIAPAARVRSSSGTSRSGSTSGLDLVGGQRVLVRAGHPLAEPALPVRRPRGLVDQVDQEDAAREGERRLHRVGQAAFGGGLGHQPVDHHLDRVLELLLECRGLGERHRLAVDPGPCEALGLQLPEQVGVLALALAHHRREHLEAGAVGQLEQPVDDLLRGLPLDRLAAGGAVRPPGPRPQQAQVVVDLGDRADGGPRVAVGRLLVDRHRRRQALDEVDVGLVHLAEELPGIGGQRLDVPALPLGEDGVEGQRGLARPGQAGEHDQGIARQVDGDVLEVVLAGAADDQSVGHEILLRGFGASPMLGGPTDSRAPQPARPSRPAPA
jgi:hypothetical protein